MSLIYRWPMQDNAASRTVVETVAAANALTKVTNTSVASVAGPGGIYPLALNVNGDLNRSIVTPTLAVNTTPTLSLAFWFRFTTAAASQVIVELSDNVNIRHGFNSVFTTTAGGALSAGVNQVTGGGFNVRYYNPAPAINQWHHFCYLFDFTQPGGVPASEARLLVNGVEPAIGNDSLFTNDNSGNFQNFPLFFGARNQNSFPTSGAYAGAHLYSHILTAGEIAALIAEGSGGKTAAAVHFFTFGF
jgi:hypothetical protein